MRLIDQTWIVVAILVLFSACGSPAETAPDPEYAALTAPSIREPANDLERAVLSKLDELEAGASIEISGQAVVAGAPYYAASGRVCREVAVAGEPARLACQIADAWAFVPSVQTGGHAEVTP